MTKAQNKMKKQNNQPLQSLLLATIAIIFLLGASASTFGQGIGAKYGSREPQTCADTKSPAKGAMTVALATKYFICNSEHIYSDNLYLVEDVSVQVGGAVPYNPRYSAPDIDVRASIFPIRASFRKYQCDMIYADKSNYGTNCTVYHQPKATGVCYKTTFGDWQCGASDMNNSEREFSMRPPGFKVDTAPAKDKAAAVGKTGNQTAGTAKAAADENKDENGFVKPDFSELEKYFEIRKWEYNIAAHKLYYIAKITKENNPIDWSISFYDADDIKLDGSQYANADSGEYAKVGDVAKYYFYLPTESIMKRVTKVSITRNIH